MILLRISDCSREKKRGKKRAFVRISVTGLISLISAATGFVCSEYYTLLVAVSAIYQRPNCIFYISIYIYTYIYMYICIYICIYVYMYIYIYMYMYVSIFMYIDPTMMSWNQRQMREAARKSKSDHLHRRAMEPWNDINPQV
jgi:hypothetical protein